MSQAITFGVDIFIRLKKSDKSIGWINARVTVSGKATEIALHEKVNAVDWDNRRERVKGNSLQVKALNTHIENVRFRIREKYRLLMEKECETLPKRSRQRTWAPTRFNLGAIS